MVINKNNQRDIGTNRASLHDLRINRICFDQINSLVEINVDGYCSVIFHKTFQFLYTSIKGHDAEVKNEIMDREEIPNSVIQDPFLENTKKEALIQSEKWNNDLFAVRILMSNCDEIKIICEEIHLNWTGHI